MAKKRKAAKAPDPAAVRDRVKELRRVPASELKASPRNWRTHPAAQKAALQGILAEVGYSDALIARELPDGSLELIDGHLRAETTPDAVVPVLVLDVTEDEANKLLLTLDPLAAMATSDAANLDALLRSVQTGDEAVADLLADLAKENGIVPEEGGGEGEGAPPATEEKFHVLVECTGEVQQQELLERLTSEGLTCRALIA